MFKIFSYRKTKMPVHLLYNTYLLYVKNKDNIFFSPRDRANEL